MKRLCLGWHEPKHEPRDLGEKEPLSDPRISHSICPECEEKFLELEGKEADRWV